MRHIYKEVDKMIFEMLTAPASVQIPPKRIKMTQKHSLVAVYLFYINVNVMPLLKQCSGQLCLDINYTVSGHSCI